jgi:hypothetical protein
MRRCPEELFQVYTEDEFLSGVAPENPVGPARAPADGRPRRRLAAAAMLSGALAGVVWVILSETQPLAGRRVRVADTEQGRPAHRRRLKDAPMVGRVRSAGARAGSTANAPAPGRRAGRRLPLRRAGARSAAGRAAGRDDARAAAIARYVVARPAAGAVASVAPAPDQRRPEFGFEQ